MIGPKLFFALVVASITLPVVARAEPAAITAPSFADLESSFAVSGALTQATAALSLSLAPATPLATAQTRLTQAGARCWPDHHKPDLVKCLYHQYDLSDGAADDIRWMVALHSYGELLHDFTVTREVDRHGGA